MSASLQDGTFVVVAATFPRFAPPAAALLLHGAVATRTGRGEVGVG
ncbi:hypothetical protein [Nocardioides eburneiflavus]|nr:hypothetical protein [Nocardioides eburneiflavus]